MTKQQAMSELIRAHKAFCEDAKNFFPETFHQSFNGKWSVAQNVEHINKSIAPIVKYFSIPKEVIETKFGLCNHSSVSKEEISDAYKEVLLKGIKAPDRLVPGSAEETWEVLTGTGNTTLNTLITQLENWNEEDLEKYNCPHLFLGNLTPREMLYFTICHEEHHHHTIKHIKRLV